MTRACHVTPRQTTQRVDRLRNLVNALLAGDMTRDEIGEVLQVGPSGVRKYLVDLGSKVTIARRIDVTPTFVGFAVYRLTISAEEAQDYLASLVGAATPRAVASPMSAERIAARDPSRHFHILADDTPYAVRVRRAPVARDVLVAAFFGAGRHEVRT
jgi:hypothetical protein